MLGIVRKTSLIFPVLLCLFVFLSHAQTVREQPFQLQHPELMAQGGSYTAVAEGYNSLFTNPAGFANGSGSITLGALSMWMRSRPDEIPGLANLLYARDGDDPDARAMLAEKFTGDGYSMGGSLGLGYVRRGLGIGFLAGWDTSFFGPSFPDGLEGVLDYEFMLVVGYSATLHLGGVRLLAGADIRPLVRVHALFDAAASAAMVNKYFGVPTSHDGTDPYAVTDALNGSGIALDAGLLAFTGPFTFGLSVRDIFDTEIRYSRNSLADVNSAILHGGLPQATPVPGDYIVPMSFSAGAAFRPDLGGFSRFLAPVIHCEVRDPFGALDPPGKQPGLTERLRVGAEVKLLSSLSLRGGWNGGLPSAGIGLHLLFLDLNFAVFETRSGPDSRKVPGAALEMAIRW